MRTKKYRGSRTCGGGTHKNRRGAGNRGGRGHAGGNAHHFIRAMREGYRPGYIYKGFSRPAVVDTPVFIVNVGELDELVSFLFENEADYITKDGDKFVVDLYSIGIDKVLGSGRVTKAMVVKAEMFSATARSKIEAAGGECVEVGDEFDEFEEDETDEETEE
ncbi:uL15m family ribosomal protein [Methanimicrococcus hacksteinii]|uniref:uL15m family ribosomal protein n=1 Tax=Methanimicrococcus hacksteinii TaxID=3028293 RepID=UPI00298EFC4E|nr:uL15m family ribosomal protein [Methanimicrococcus sp. At1]